MDWQPLFSGGLTLAIIIVSAYIRLVHSSLGAAKSEQAALADKVNAFQIKVAENYVTHTDLRRIEDALVRIEAKMDVKADK